MANYLYLEAKHLSDMLTEGQFSDLPDFKIDIEPSKEYAGRWKLGNQNLYIPIDRTKPLQNSSIWKRLLKQDHVIADDHYKGDFYNFYNKWTNNELVLYRGFGGCHFCWPELLRTGEIRSGGDWDYPQYTMRDKNEEDQRRTCWLPSDPNLDICQACTLSDIDSYTDAKSKAQPIPIGITVAVECGKDLNPLSLCWLNPGETVIRGPLTLNQYMLYSITWFLPPEQKIEFFRFPQGFTSLPPQRPYKPENETLIINWLDSQEYTTWKEVADAQFIMPKNHDRAPSDDEEKETEADIQKKSRKHSNFFSKPKQSSST